MTDKIVTNILRVVAYFLMVLGIYVFLSPIVELLGYIPLVGGFLKATTGALIFLAALIVCIPLFLVTFSLAWLVYHPKTGILVLLLAGVIVGIIVVLDNVYGGGV
jgi:hypothetical protein